MFGYKPNTLSRGVKKVLSEHAVGSYEPDLAFDFIDNEYTVVGGTKSLNTAVTHSRSGNATMVDGYGPELVTNGTFDSDLTGWSNSIALVSWNSPGYARVDRNGGTYSDHLYQDVSTTPGVAYVVTFNIIAVSNAVDHVFNGINTGSVSATGSYSRVFVATSSTARITFAASQSTAATFSIDNISVREMPVLKWAPHNLLTYSEDFSNAAWTKSNTTVTANAAEAPDGTTTADKLIADATTGGHNIYQSVSVVAGNTYTVNVRCKKAEYGYAGVWFYDGANKYAVFNLNTGEVSSTSGLVSHSIVADSLGYYSCSIEFTSSNSGTYYAIVGPFPTGTYAGYTGDGTSGIYVWGAHAYRSDLGGMVDNPETGDSYVRTAGRPVGPELVTNGTFDTDSDWTKGTGWTISGGVASCDGTQIANSNLTQGDGTGLTTGSVYEVVFDVTRSAGSVQLYIKGAGTGSVTASGTYTFYTVAGSGSEDFTFVASSTFVGSIDNISVKELDVDPSVARYLPRVGHHEFNGYEWVNKGLLAESEARTNLLQYSDFNPPFWSVSSASITVDAATSPDGSNNAVLINYSTTDDSAFRGESVTTGIYTVSCFMKAGTMTAGRLWFTVGGYSTGAYVDADLINGTISTVTSVGSATDSTALIEDCGAGWYRVSVSSNLNSTTTGYLAVRTDGVQTGTIYCYGAQLETGSVPSSYVPTSGATATRAAETFTVPAANLPWPQPEYAVSEFGPELVTNGGFDTDSDWTKGTGWTISGGEAVGSSAETLTQSAATTSGTPYLFKFTVSNYSAGTITPNISGRSGPSFTGNGTFEAVIVAAGGAAFNLLGGGGFTGTVDNVSVRELTSELVTNGGFDADSDWTKGTGWTISGGVASFTNPTGTSLSQTGLPTMFAGRVYMLTFDMDYTSGECSVGVNVGGGIDTFGNFAGTATHTAFVVPTLDRTGITFTGLGASVFSIDNVSVREINPLSVSIAMKGEMDYADEGLNPQVVFSQWQVDASNRIIQRLRTDGANTGLVQFLQQETGTLDSVTTGAYTPGLNVPFDIASRHGSTFINGAVDGVALTEDTTPTALPDLSSTDLSLAYDFMGTISEFRIWDKDLGDSGIEEATEPSTEPTLSLTFDGQSSSFTDTGYLP